MVAMECTYCRADWSFPGRPGELQQLIAIDVGHVMPTLGLAIAHLECPRCERTRLKLVAGHQPAQPVMG